MNPEILIHAVKWPQEASPFKLSSKKQRSVLECLCPGESTMLNSEGLPAEIINVNTGLALQICVLLIGGRFSHRFLLLT